MDNTEQMPTVNKRIPVPHGRKPKPRVPQAVRTAADEYKAAYKACYGVPIGMKWDGRWIRVAGQVQGVTPRRLKEMTAQLRRRAGG